MWRRFAQSVCLAAGLGLLAGAPAARAADEPSPKVLTKAEFKTMAVEGLKKANGTSSEEAAQRFETIMASARTYAGKGNLARQVRTGYGHYEKSKNIRKKHATMVLSAFTAAKVGGISQKEAAAMLSAWPQG
jgi:hypothetical protein